MKGICAPVDNERIYIVEFRSLGDKEPTRELITACSVPELFEIYTGMTDMVYFAFEDITGLSVEDVERKLTYVGKYV